MGRNQTVFDLTNAEIVAQLTKLQRPPLDLDPNNQAMIGILRQEIYRRHRRNMAFAKAEQDTRAGDPAEYGDSN